MYVFRRIDSMYGTHHYIAVSRNITNEETKANKDASEFSERVQYQPYIFINYRSLAVSK